MGNPGVQDASVLSGTFAEWIAGWRSRRQLSAAALAGLLGVNPARIAEWEAGATVPSEEQMFRIRECLAGEPQASVSSGALSSTSDNEVFLAGEEARALADDFLANEVGNLLMAGEPRLGEGEGEPVWTMPVLLGNAIRGLLGEVGTIRVDARTGDVLFDDRERVLVKEHARELTSPRTP